MKRKEKAGVSANFQKLSFLFWGEAFKSRNAKQQYQQPVQRVFVPLTFQPFNVPFHGGFVPPRLCPDTFQTFFFLFHLLLQTRQFLLHAFNLAFLSVQIAGRSGIKIFFQFFKTSIPYRRNSYIKSCLRCFFFFQITTFALLI